MNGDFGAEVDAALNDHLAKLKAAADEARSRVDEGASALPQPPERDVTEPSPRYSNDVPAGGPAVSFEGMDDEYQLEADAEGIPLPEENL